MKLFFIPLFLLLFLCSKAFSQGIPSTGSFHPDCHSQFLQALPNSTGGFIYCGTSNDGVYPFWPSSEFYYAKTDANGNVLWEQTNSEIVMDFVGLYSAIRTTDGNFAVTGALSSCDMPEGIGFLQKVSSQTGIPIFSKEYAFHPNQHNYFSALFERQDSGFLIQLGSDFMQVSSIGDSLNWIQTGIPEIENPVYSKLENGSWLAFGATKFYALDSNFQITDSSNRIGWPAERLGLNHLVMSNGQYLIRTDMNFTIVDSLLIGSFFGGLRKFVKKGDSLIVTDFSLSLLVDTNLSVVNIFPMSVPAALHPNGGRYSAGILSIFGRGRSDAGFANFALDGSSSVLLEDIRVSQIHFDDFEFHPFDSTGVLGYGTWNARITVKNEGNVPVTSFSLNFVETFFTGSLCGPVDWDRLVTGIYLLPGDSIEILWNGMRNAFMSSNTAGNYPAFAWTESPNFHLDANPFNDTISMIQVSIPEKTLIKASIYPNPGSGSFRINWGDNQQGTIRVKDLPGKMVLESQIHSGINEFQVPNLTPGVYIVECISGNTRWVKKWQCL